MDPYETSPDLQRFNQRNTAFARSHWDPSCAAYGDTDQSTEEGAGLDSHTPRPGYGREDLAQEAGAWAVARLPINEASAPDPEYSPAPDKAPASAPAASSLPDRGGDRRGDPDGDAVAPQTLTRHLKQTARLYGADLVGIARVNPLWVYARDQQEDPVELPAGMDTAVVLAVSMDYGRMAASPSAIAGAATGAGYSRMAFTSACVARYLTRLGWRALAADNGMALSIPLAIDAGLGELGRNGLLITPEFGPRVRLCKVFTNAPLAPDVPRQFGVREFCDVCMKCAATCPSRSISREGMTRRGPSPSNNPGATKWYINPDTCLAFWRRNGTSCSNCIRTCPFNKLPGRIHGWARGLIRLRSRTLNRLLVRVDDLCGYGSSRAARKAIERYGLNGSARG
jgi:reductive dehalogenase